MKGRKNLERAIVLGLILSTGVYGTAWAKSITGPISDNNYNDTYQEDVIITNDDDSEAAIKIENKNNTEIYIGTNGEYDITLDSEGSGIRTQGGDGSIILTSGKDNIINFAGKGNGIDADSNLTITLNAEGNNKILSADNAGEDGVNLGKNQSGKIQFTAGNSNIIKVTHDGIYTNEDSTADSEYIAVNGNNEIESGNNGIDHRGNGDVILTANNINKITATNGDGIRVDGSGDVVLTAKENTITAGDNGIQSETQGTISIISTNGDNNINAATTAIEVSYGNVIVNSNNDVNLNTENFNGKDVGAGIHLDYGNNNGYGTNEKALYVDINAGGNFNIGSEATAATSGIQVDTFAGTVDIDAQKGVYMNVNGDNLIGATESGHIIINAKDDIILNAESNGAMHMLGSGYITNRNNQYVTAGNDELIGINGIKKSDVTIKTNGNIKFTGTDLGGAYYNIGIFATGTRGSVNHNTPVNDGGNEDNLNYIDENGYVKSAVNQTLLEANKIDMTISNPNGYAAIGILAQQSDNVFVNLESKIGTNLTALSENGNSIAIDTAEGNVTIKSTKGSNVIKALTQSDTGMGIGIQTESEQSYVNHVYSNRVNLESKNNNEIYATTTAIANTGSDSIVDFDAEQGNNYLKAFKSIAIDSSNKSKTILTSLFGNNNIEAGEIYTDKETQLQYGASYAVNALSGSSVELSAGESNYLLGAVYASGSTGTEKNKQVTNVTMKGNANQVYSNAYIDNAGGLTDKNVISALYAQKGANISLDGDYNILGTNAVSSSDDLERVVWAYDTADINITGLTAISTDSYDLATNSKDIAVVAGTATGLDKLSEDKILSYSGDRANVNINYESDSSITGDILSAYAGTVNIAANTENTRAGSDSKIYIRGNLLAGNNGILNVDLGNGGTLTGRVDDYGDAGLNTGHGEALGTENSFFNPAFSSEIKAHGEVNLTMGKGSRWDVTGQSWITQLNTTENAEDTLISLEKAKEDLNSNASALTIGELNGSTRFYMNLDGDRSASDMLYIKKADGQYDIYLQEEVTSTEINAGGFDGLRFATVGEGSNASFTVKSKGTGSAFDVEYKVDTDSYVGNDENTAYNSTSGDGTANVEKPGNASVDDFFGLTNATTEETPEAATNDIMLMAENEEAADAAANANTGLDEVTNFKIVARAGEELSDTGETILNMSRANYSNAIYMDRLNKRLGEARYINAEEDEGMWVRIRHDRIGKTDAYRSQNTMYELGYDKKQECDNGERRVGMAIDYMHGDTGYSDIAGKGEIDRYGLWLYDTWMGKKGHYVDYVAKWGHLSNDFEVYTMRNGDKVTGDYSNNVFSVSAEYGRKKDLGSDWYIEPQIQAQLARVTGADYVTNQGTKVSVDGINSLIGRAGFRLGKDFGEEKQSTVYIKADVMHEFLGDQDVSVLDKSSDNKWAGISYENEGTWYDVGFGFATMMSKNSYAFLDLEKSFGNDNDETYQINVGMQWSF